MGKNFKSIGAVLLAVTLALPGINIANRSTSETVKAGDEYSVVWEDDFNGNSLNRDIWNVEVNGNGGGNQELQYYCDSTENIEVSNGTLKIKGLKKNYNGKRYTSGRINTKGKAEFRYGKVEAKIKLPSFQGAWPAFWMLGANYDSVGWPRCGEIDILEAINTEKLTYGTLHWYGEGQQDKGNNSGSVLPDNFDRTQWHTYAIEWTSKEMKFMVDDKVFFTKDITDGYMGEFRKPQFIIFNVAIGGQWPGFQIDDNAFPATMEVDYVRVLQRESDNGIVQGTGVDDKRPSMVPDEVVTRNVLQNHKPWEFYCVNKEQVAKATGTSNSPDYFKNKIDYLGITSKAIKAYLKGIDYIPGETYKCSFDLKSTINKNILIKVIGEDPEEDTFGVYGLTLEANKNYHFSENIKIDKDYDGRLDFIVEMGGRIAGEYMPANTQLDIELSNASIVGRAGKIPEVETTEKNTEQITKTPETPTDRVAPTTKTTPVKETTAKIKIATPSVKKIKRSKNKKSITLVWKNVKGANGYQIRYSANKKLKNYKTKNVKAVKYTLKKLNPKKVYYVKIRAYVKPKKGKNIYGQFSKVKKIK